MAVEFFLIDAPQAVPAEFAAWEAAEERHHALFQAYLDADLGSAASKSLELQAIDAKLEADRLERVAREAWLKAKRPTA